MHAPSMTSRSGLLALVLCAAVLASRDGAAIIRTAPQAPSIQSRALDTSNEKHLLARQSSCSAGSKACPNNYCAPSNSQCCGNRGNFCYSNENCVTIQGQAACCPIGQQCSGIRSETVVVPGSTSAAITRTSSTASRTTTSTASGVVVTAGSTSGIRNVNLDTEVSYSGIWTTVNQGCGNTAPHRILNTGSSDVWSATINFDQAATGFTVAMSATAGATYSIYVGDTSKIPVRLTGNATIASNNQGNNLPSTNSAACVLTYSASFSIGQRQVVIQFENARSAREKRQSFEWPWIQINQISAYSGSAILSSAKSIAGTAGPASNTALPSTTVLPGTAQRRVTSINQILPLISLVLVTLMYGILYQ